MAKKTWKTHAGGDWAVASNWKGGLPGAADTAFLGKTTSPITSAADVTIASLRVTGANELLEITAGAFTATGFSNAGFVEALGGSITLGGGFNIITNNRTVEAAGGAVTLQQTTLRQTSAALVEAVGAGSTVTLTSAQIQGGKLSTSGGGLIETGDAKSILNGATVLGAVQNSGTVQVNQGTGLTLDGAISNSGEIFVNAPTAFTGLLIGAFPVTLSGAGQVVLAADGYIAGAAAGASLTNFNNTITGGGIIKGPLNLTNSAAGVIDDTTGRMIINTGATVTNRGLVESTGTGILQVVSTTINSTGGGSVVDGAKMQLNGATLLGGSFTVNSGAVLQTAGGKGSDISGVATVTNAGLVQVSNASNLTVGGSIANSGTIQVQGVSTFTGLVVAAAGVTLNGGGVVDLFPKGYIGGAVVGAGVTNFDNTIEGGGFIKTITLTNDAAGTINANAGRMALNTGNTVVNDGLVESSAAGSLLVSNSTIDSSGGGTVVDGHIMQLNNATLTGGSLTVNKGALFASSVHAGTVNLGGGTVNNAGVIQGVGGGLTINGDVANANLVEAINGNLTVTGAITGAGFAKIVGTGVLEVDGAFAENVQFTKGSTGKLVLGDSAGFTGRVSGLSFTGANQIDLKDIAFSAAYTTSYAGSAVSGTLTINNGAVVVDTIRLLGNYVGHTFTLSDGGANGTVVKDPATTATATSLASAIAGFGAAGGHSVAPATVLTQAPHMLALSHAA